MLSSRSRLLTVYDAIFSQRKVFSIPHDAEQGYGGAGRGAPGWKFQNRTTLEVTARLGDSWVCSKNQREPTTHGKRKMPLPAVSFHTGLRVISRDRGLLAYAKLVLSYVFNTLHRFKYGRTDAHEPIGVG